MITPEQLLTIGTLVITAASGIAAILPAPNPGTRWAKIVALINLLALNVGHAGNATPAGLKTELNNTSTTRPTL